MWNFTCEIPHVKFHMWNFTCEISHVKFSHVKFHMWRICHMGNTWVLKIHMCYWNFTCESHVNHMGNTSQFSVRAPSAFPGPERPSALRRRPPWWYVAVGADGWFLVIFHGLSILCMEDVSAHGGGCVGLLCECLRSAGMWRVRGAVLRWSYAANAHYHPLSPLLRFFLPFA